MNVPLDNLYHWVRSCSTEPVSIYTFSPHGSKNIKDLNFFDIDDSKDITPDVICHDQEPLNYEIYRNIDAIDLWSQIQQLHPGYRKINKDLTNLVSYYEHLDFFVIPRLLKGKTIFDRYILLHSEKNSPDVEQFARHAVPVYYWSHALIARDWYRFAEHDARLDQHTTNKETFLVYCRAWTGTREYRLKFLELLIDHNLIQNCKTSIMHQDQEYDLDSYVCTNSSLQPNNIARLTSLASNDFPAQSSADYCAKDFVSTDISVVLETIADDRKIHLTEKTLRPIACGHPFMLVAGPGSLEYLKSYGFKTFAPWINEDYDQETDVVRRMQMIVTEMHRINHLPEPEKKQLLDQLKKIAAYNKQRFFENDFFNQVQQELVENLNTAVAQVKVTRGHHYLTKKVLTKIYQIDPDSRAKKIAIAKVLRQLRRDPSTSLKQIIDQYPNGFFNT